MAAVRIRLTFNTPANCWVADIRDADGNPVLMGVPVVTGTDLLGQFQYLGLGGQLIAQTDHAQDDVPTYGNLGTLGHLFFLSP